MISQFGQIMPMVSSSFVHQDAELNHLVGSYAAIRTGALKFPPLSPSGIGSPLPTVGLPLTRPLLLSPLSHQPVHSPVRRSLFPSIETEVPPPPGITVTMPSSPPGIAVIPRPVYCYLPCSPLSPVGIHVRPMYASPVSHTLVRSPLRCSPSPTLETVVPPPPGVSFTMPPSPQPVFRSLSRRPLSPSICPPSPAGAVVHISDVPQHVAATSEPMVVPSGLARAVSSVGSTPPSPDRVDVPVLPNVAPSSGVDSSVFARAVLSVDAPPPSPARADVPVLSNVAPASAVDEATSDFTGDPSVLARAAVDIVCEQRDVRQFNLSELPDDDRVSERFESTEFA